MAWPPARTRIPSCRSLDVPDTRRARAGREHRIEGDRTSTPRHRAPRGRTTRPAPLAASLVAAAPQLRLRRVFARFWPLTRPFRLRLAVCLAIVAVSPAMDAAAIWIFKVLVDDVLVPRDFALFPPVAAAYVAITVAGGLLSFVDDYLGTWVGERFVLTLRTSLFAHLHRMSLGFFERRRIGDLMSRLSSDVTAIEQLVLSGVMEVIGYGVKILIFGALLFFLNWRLAVAALVAVPLFAIASRYFSTRIKAASREKRRRTGTIAAVAEESLGNAALVQAYGRQDAETRRFHAENLGAFAAQMVATRLRATFGPFVDLLETAAVLLVVGIGIWQLASGAMTLGGLLVFTAYLAQLYGPIRAFGGLANTASAASAGAERIIEILDEKPSVTDPADPRPLRRAHGAVGVEGVSFAYPGVGTPSLSDVSLRIAPGGTLAVVGAGGAGKTTLAKLLLRFYDPDRGRITLDGVDLRELALGDLRRNVAVVLQETLVFDGTVRDNILWGRPEARERDVVAAAEAADAHEFVSALPDGYDTRIGQRGRMLSGGQRQRLAIARAMIRNAPVLLLDEPTAGLDAGSAARVLTPLRRLMAGRTSLIISHDLLTVTDADQILYLEEGRVAATGTHSRLLASSPGYAHLHRLQQGPEPRTAAPRTVPHLPHRPAVRRSPV
ncbi:MAG: ATP-binding cassette, subfamily bacterial [Pseudonocardiales bacterium]|nr:ATP-binding cassette, subfamily bacterial [Pseudonocardiales bacterium]